MKNGWPDDRPKCQDYYYYYAVIVFCNKQLKINNTSSTTTVIFMIIIINRKLNLFSNSFDYKKEINNNKVRHKLL